MKRLAHISDLHFGKTDPAVVLTLDDDIDEFDADLLIVTGDLTQRARLHEFEQARGFLDGLPVARLVVPGNHDIAPLFRPLSRLLHPYERYARFFPPTLDSFFADDQLLVIGLNTVHPLRWKEGGVTAAQLDWIESLVQRHPDSFHVLAAHHPLVHVDDAPLEHRVLGSESLLRTLQRVGIDLVLSGHLHASRNGPAARAFGVTDAILVAQASTATSTRLRGHVNAYNRITIGRDHVHIELRAFDGDRFVSARIGNYERRHGLWRPLAPQASAPHAARV
jgi:3',5'-cyclic AMP phosphodiesterase CpdA